MGGPDRVDRRQVEHREAHRRDRREALLGELEGATSGRHRPLRPREHLVPGGVAGDLTLDPERVRDPAMVAWLRSAVRRISPMVASRVASWTLVSAGGRRAPSLAASAVSARRSDLETTGRSARAAASAAPSARSSSTSTPAWNRIARSRAQPPQTSRIPTTAKLQAPSRRGLIQAPYIVLRLGLHGHLDHPGGRGVGRERPGAGPVPHPGEQGIVAVGKCARRHAQRKSAGGLGRELAAVDGWPDVFDDHSPPIAEQPVGDGVAHRIHLRPKVASQASRRDRLRNGSSTQSPYSAGEAT